MARNHRRGLRRWVQMALTHRLPCGVALAALACFAPSLDAQSAADSVLPPSAFPAPDRPVARIVAAQWTGEDSRDDAGEVDNVIRLLAIKSGTRVADIGAGSGYYVMRLAPLVAPSGRVFAEDIIPSYLEALRARVKREAVGPVTVIAGEPHDPKLPRQSVDVALMIHMYHEIEQPFGLLWHLTPAMAPGGRLGILDIDGPTATHGTPPALLKCELAAAGWSFVSLERTAEREYVAIFSPPAKAPSPAQIRLRLAASACTQRE